MCFIIYTKNRYYMLFFFFSSRRRHTRLTCDWSSDVCSSDLLQGIGLELREPGAEREHEALQLLGRDHADRGVVDGRAGERVAEGHVRIGVLTRRRVREGDVRVQRRVLEARSGLDRRDDLARHAELGEASERGLLVVPEVAHRLVEADQALLDQVLGIATGEEVRARLQTDEARVAADQRVEGNLVAVTGPDDELEIRKLALLSLSRIRWG